LIWRNDLPSKAGHHGSFFSATGGNPMTVENQAPSVVERLTNTFSDWLKHRRELSEMRQLTVTDFCRIANDLRLSPAALEELVRHGHTADELQRLLGALGISAQDLLRIEPMVVQDMERVCALCEHKRQCDRDLASGASAEHYQEYCLNAPTIAQLRETKQRHH
jgi:transcriptional regulator with XRE-family HTH domain